MPVKVIHSYPVWLPLTQTWMHQLVKSLPPEAIESHVVSLDRDNLEQFPVSNLHVFRDHSPFRFFAGKIAKRLRIPVRFDFLKSQIGKIQPNIVHSHFGNIGCREWRIVKSTGAKHVVTFYGMDVSLLPTTQPSILPKYRAMFEQTDLFLAEGPHMAKQIESLGCPADKIRVQRLGIPLEKFPFQPRQWKPESPLKVLIAASFRPKKGIPIALESLGRIATEMPIEITIIGDASANPESQAEKQKILDTIEHHQLRERTKLLGYQNHARMCEIAYDHHLFLTPSVTAPNGDNEGGSPVTITELAASGMPIVSTYHCDIPEVLEDSKTGWLAAEGDVDELTDKIRQAISEYQQWPARLRELRSHIEDQFDLQKQGAKLSEIYRKLAD